MTPQPKRELICSTTRHQKKKSGVVAKTDLPWAVDEKIRPFPKSVDRRLEPLEVGREVFDAKHEPAVGAQPETFRRFSKLDELAHINVHISTVL